MEFAKTSGLEPSLNGEPRSTGLPTSEAGSGSAFEYRSGSSPTEDQQTTNSGGIAQKAEHSMDAGMQKSAESLKSVADKARSMSEGRDGTVGSLGTQAADAIEKGAGYLEQGDSEQLMRDLEAMVRRRPVESLLVAAGAGFVLSKVIR